MADFSIPINGEWRSFDYGELARMRIDGRKEQADAISALHEEYQKNPLSFFLPHGFPFREKSEMLGGSFLVEKSEYPKEYANDGVAALNDWSNDVVLVLGPNQTGKTKIGAAWTSLRVVPCDPKWMVFTHHGVRCPVWRGPRVWMVASYSWDNVSLLWRRLQETLPRYELGVYATLWGKYPGETGKAKSLLFGDGKPKHVQLTCGSVIKMLCYDQDQVHWEGFESDGGWFDEQPKEENFVGWQRGTTTRGNYTPCCMTLTGHVIQSRPDTGAGGWIKRDFWDGANRRGKKIGRYHLSIESTPDAIITKKKKAELWKTHVDPSVIRSPKQQRAAIARYWGGWETTGGIILSDWMPDIHCVDPFPIPKTWTRYRAVDHGFTNCAGLWMAVSPAGDCFFYREYLDSRQGIAEHAEAIIEASGNKRVQIDTFRDQLGILWPYYQEQMCGEEYVKSVLDTRSFGSKTGTGITIGQMYNMFGLTVTRSSGQMTRDLIPLMRQWLAIDMTRRHPITKQMGGARCYVFNTCVCFRREIEGWVEKTLPNGKVIPTDKDDHLLSCFKFLVAENIRYYGDDNAESDALCDDEHGAGAERGRGWVVVGNKVKRSGSVTGY